MTGSPVARGHRPLPLADTNPTPPAAETMAAGKWAASVKYLRRGGRDCRNLGKRGFARNTESQPLSSKKLIPPILEKKRKLLDLL